MTADRTQAPARGGNATDQRALLEKVQRAAEAEGWTSHVPAWPASRRNGAEGSVLRWRVGFALPLALFVTAAAVGFSGRIEFLSKLRWDATPAATATAYDEQLTVDLFALLIFALAIFTMRFGDCRVCDIVDAPRRWRWRRSIRRLPALVLERSAAIDSATPEAHRHYVLLSDTAGHAFEVTTNRRTRRKLPPGTAIYAFVHDRELLEYRRYRP